MKKGLVKIQLNHIKEILINGEISLKNVKRPKEVILENLWPN